MSVSKCFRNLDDLACGLIRTEIDRCTDGDRSHVPCLLDRAKHYLVELVRIRQKLIMIDLNDKRYFMSISTCDRAKDAECRRDGVAASLNRKLYNIRGVKILWIRRKTRTRGVLDPLIDRQYRQITRPPQSPIIFERLKRTQNIRIPIRVGPNAIDKIAAWKM